MAGWFQLDFLLPLMTASSQTDLILGEPMIPKLPELKQQEDLEVQKLKPFSFSQVLALSTRPPALILLNIKASF